MATPPQHDRERYKLGVLACVHVVMCLVSLISVAYYQNPAAFDPRTFHTFFDVSRLPLAVLTAGAFALLVPLFVFARL